MSDQTCDCCKTGDNITADDRWLTEPVMNAPLPSDVKRHMSQFFGREIETLDALAGEIREVTGSDGGSDDGCGGGDDASSGSLAIDDLCRVAAETPHQATTAAETYYFRCFYDGIMLAHLVDEPVEIRTESPAGELIEMRASPNGAIDVTPSDAVMSFSVVTDVEPSTDDDANPTIGEIAEMVMCPYVKAFPTRDAYAYWAAGSDGATVGMPLAAGVPFAAALTKQDG